MNFVNVECSTKEINDSTTIRRNMAYCLCIHVFVKSDRKAKYKAPPATRTQYAFLKLIAKAMSRSAGHLQYTKSSDLVSVQQTRHLYKFLHNDRLTQDDRKLSWRHGTQQSSYAQSAVNLPYIRLGPACCSDLNNSLKHLIIFPTVGAGGSQCLRNESRRLDIKESDLRRGASSLLLLHRHQPPNHLFAKSLAMLPKRKYRQG